MRWNFWDDEQDDKVSMRLSHGEQAKITELLMGRKITKVNDRTLELDNGTVLILRGNEGGCGCSAGDYPLTELNGVDNIITAVEFDYRPIGDGDYDYDADDYSGPDSGYYRIFVYADNQKINLATFIGHDGNGYYGTGFSIDVKLARE